MCSVVSDSLPTGSGLAVKNVRTTSCTFQIADFFTIKRCEVPAKRIHMKLDRTKVTVKKCQIGLEQPHFFGFQPPKKFVGSLPPLVRTEDAEENHARAERGGLSFGS